MSETEGRLRTCLASENGLNVKKVLRSGAGAAELVELVARAIRSKPDRHPFSVGDAAPTEASASSGDMSRIGG